ncbi:MAG: hypothetical protein M3Y56_14715 [Armatimonadota bacterium]|nr:hypothetical protein [Armatimonadota bacterium]
MKKWQKNLISTFNAGRMVEIDRSPKIADTIEGYVVGASDRFVMLHALDRDYMLLNGYIVLRWKDIRRYRTRDNNKFIADRALALKGIRPIPKLEIDLSDFPALLRSANAHFPLVTIHQEIKDSNTCFIGHVQAVTDKTLTLAQISPAAKWNRTRCYKLKHITRVDFGGGYEETLALVAEDEARKLLNQT